MEMIQNFEDEYEEDQQITEADIYDPKKYNPRKIPPNWDLAKIHALSRRVGPEFKGGLHEVYHVCPCCGYQVKRDRIKIGCDIKKLNFLGAGYPLFYNFILNCIMILIVFLLTNGLYNIITNASGNYCEQNEKISQKLTRSSTENFIDFFNKKQESYYNYNSDFIHKQHPSDQKQFQQNQSNLRILSFYSNKEKKDITQICKLNWISKFSLPNKKSSFSELKIQQYLNFLTVAVIVIQLSIFRRSQKVLNQEVDISQQTPSDYTIMVKNIPKNLKINYENELKELFQYKIFDKATIKKGSYEVQKINLVYDCSEIEELEGRIEKKIQQKQIALRRNFQLDSEEVKEIDEEIGELEQELEVERIHIMNTQSKFAGIAFVSFNSEQEKYAVIKKCQISLKRKIKEFLTYDKDHDCQDGWNNDNLGLIFKKKLLQIEEAPEPNDINWDFINISISEKIKSRIISYITIFLFIGSFFSVICLLIFWQSEYKNKANQLNLKFKQGAYLNYQKVQAFSIIISCIIVLFNKFILGHVIHHIINLEKISTRTRFNISFATKYALGLFFNTALITLIVEIFTFKNFYGVGGLIYTEFWIFMLNSLVPQFLWWIDPWMIHRIIKRNQETKKKQKSALTQQQANQLMEMPNYNMAKRYSDNLKTMWFTFFYGPILPIGILWSIIGMSIYYWIDKYNLLRRRTLHESISIEMTIEMIELLEWIIPLFAFGNFIFAQQIFGYASWQDIIIFIFGLIYIFAPMDQINQKLFPVYDRHEYLKYKEIWHEFDTDYDRENPVSKKQALQDWIHRRKHIKIIVKERIRE